MRKYLFAAIVSGAAVAVSSPVAAQDTTPFSGLRVEGLVGYDTSDVEGENSDGVVYGAQVGYDFQSNGAVFGIEAEVSDSTVDECVGGVLVADLTRHPEHAGQVADRARRLAVGSRSLRWLA